MYRKILVPLDGSEFSECSLANVRTLTSESKDSQVILLRVIESPPDYYMSYKVAEDLRRRVAEAVESDTREYLARVAENLAKDGLTAGIAVTEGKPADEIVNFASKNGVDLIVMTTHGRSGPSRLAFGSVAEKVIRTSQIPVLSISPPGCRIAA